MSKSKLKKLKPWYFIQPDDPYKGDIGSNIHLRLALIAGDPKSQILVAHSYIELLVSLLVEQLCKNGKKIAENDLLYPHGSKLIILNEIGMIDDEEFSRLDRLRDLRNNIAHQPFFEVTKQDLTDFWNADPKDLSSMLSHIISMITSRHLDILARFILPNMTDPVELRYQKKYAALSHKWVEIIYPLIQVQGWTCDKCGVSGKDFGKSHPPKETSYLNPSDIYCKKCLKSQEIPLPLIKEHCGEKPKKPEGKMKATLTTYQMSKEGKLEIIPNPNDGN